MRRYLLTSLLAVGLSSAATMGAGYAKESERHPGTKQIVIDGYQFEPKSVTITVGTNVTWVNRDAAPHTVTSSDMRFASSGALDSGDRYSYTFITAGTYEYYCTLHPFMTGRIIVLPLTQDQGSDKAMDAQTKPILAIQAPVRTRASSYPEPFASRMKGREKRPLGDLFGLKNFGVNLTRLEPDGVSSLRHCHTTQDEFLYVLSGSPILITNSGESELLPGMCVGFRAGNGDAHHLVNRTKEDVVYLEIGDRSPGDSGLYPDDDIQAVTGEDGTWIYLHKDGSPY